MNLFIGAAEREQQTGEKMLNMLSSVCSYPSFPFQFDDDDYDYHQYQSDFLLDLCSRVKDYETQTGRSVLPSLQSVLSAPAVWFIKLSETKTSILLEVLKLQSEKKAVELDGCSYEESEVRSFLQCVPYISQLSFCQSVNLSDQTEFLMNLFIGAAEREQQTGEKILNMLSSVCSHQRFPLHELYMRNSAKKHQSDFLLALYSRVKDYETQTGRSVLPSLQSVFQSAPAVWFIKLSETKTSILLEVLKLQSEKKAVQLDECSYEESEVRSFLQCVPYISQLRFCRPSVNLSDQTEFLMNLFIGAAEREQQTGEKMLNMLSSVCSYPSFPFQFDDDDYDYHQYQSDFLLDLYSRVKDYETQTGRSVLPSLQSVLSAPAVWFIKLSETKTSILLEVLKLQSEKKAVQLIGCSYEESEVRSFLQCVPYISQLSFCQSVNLSDQTEFLMNLFIGAAEREQQTGEKILNMLSSVCSHQRFPLHELYMRNSAKKHQSDFLLALYSRVKDYETQTGRSVLPSLQSVLSAPAVWFIKLSETKTSILLEVLKLQSEKKAVELIGCSYEESEVRSFLQCVPYISQLSFCYSVNLSDQTEFLMNLFIGAAEREQQTGEKILNMLSSVCSYPTFPFQFDYGHQDRLDFLLDLYSRVKDYETQTGRSVLPSLQSVFQSAPAVWSIKLSETKTSILLEVLKLQSEKKAVQLDECSYEESEVRSFLQCVPYISQLRFCQSVNLSDQTEFLMNLFIGAAEREQQTGEKMLNMLSSVCSYPTFPFQFDDDDYDYHQDRLDFLLDLYSRVKDYETQTGRSVLPSLQSVFQSAPAVWFIKLSETKTSILLEVLKLQSEKKAVELIGCSYEESEVRSFLQCVPYISQLRFCRPSVNLSDQTEFLMNLFIGAAEREQQTGEKMLNMLSSVCSYPTFPFQFDDGHQYRLDFLLDLYSRVKDYETQTGRSVLPSLQSVFQSAPAVWSIKLSETKTSILLEVLKLQSEKKAVELIGCSYEESEVRSFLQCVPYISQLRFCQSVNLSDQRKFLMNLFIGAAEREQQTGEKMLNMLSSVCSYPSFPFQFDDDDYDYHQYRLDFLLDLYSRVKDYETQTGRSVLPSLQSVFQSAPAVWSIKLSETKTSILLEVLKLQSEKKAVQLIGCSYEESEVRSFLQCVPYISQLSFYQSVNLSDQTKFLMNLFIGAAEREQQTGEKMLNMLSSVCSHQRFPLHELYMRNSAKKHQSDFLLDLYSRVKDYETQTGRSVLPSLQSVLSAPAVWSIKLSETKTSTLLEVLKLQSEKKAVELIGCSYEESEVRSFLQCVPYISQLSCDPGFFQSVCTSFPVTSEQEVQQMSSLLQLLDFNLLLTGCLSSETCSSVGRVLGFCGSKVNLSLTCTKISAREASLLFKHTPHIRSLRLSSDLVLLLLQWVRTGEVSPSLIIEDLSVIESMTYQSEKVLLSVVSSVAFLLSSWTVRQLDLSELSIPTQHLTALLCHHGSLTIRVNKENLQQLPALLHEIQDQELTQCFFSKVGGDLTSCFLDWEVLYFLLQHSSGQTITVNLKKISSVEENFSHLLPFLDRLVFKRPSPSFVLSAIRHIHEAHSSHSVPSLLRSLDHVISLTCTELDSVDFSALLFILHHSDGVKLNLLWTSIPAENMESLLFTLDKVSQLSVDRTLLLRLVHCCAAAQQRASSVLLGALQHRLDLSCSSFMDLAEEEQRDALRLTAADCWAISTILGYSSQETQLDLRDCEVGDNGLDALLPVLDRVRLRASKALLLQLLSLIPQRDSVRWAESLWRALDGELDLSHTTLDQGTCSSLAQVLDSSEGVTELDLSHCQLTDQLLSMLIPQLHKVQVLDLSHNNLTDVSTNMLLCLTSISSCSHTVRVFGNSIKDKQPFTDKRFEIW
ncbi:uncharacterized protein LOC115791115 [Archocentrus centrarchus]|uniref:uncharacterized protein LOC115791115 n=1 Tax=Archocentrus centrarchus TaxID=63155 RepID=UPI0011EA2014|nr:uncharacterized protein LOC115791115 [Archocentrus centrarchus]